MTYEDVYVRAFKKYPHDFQLGGYPDYPDTELMSKKIYDLRKNGLIQVHKKFIAITEKGKSFVDGLMQSKRKQSIKNELPKLLSRDITNQIDRIKNTDVFHLFVSNKKDQIVDTDFFSYLGTTVRIIR